MAYTGSLLVDVYDRSLAIGWCICAVSAARQLVLGWWLSPRNPMAAFIFKYNAADIDNFVLNFTKTQFTETDRNPQYFAKRDFLEISGISGISQS